MFQSPVYTAALSDDIKYAPEISYKEKYRQLLVIKEKFNKAGTKRLLREYQSLNHPTPAVRNCGHHLIPTRRGSLRHYSGSKFNYAGSQKCKNVLCTDCGPGKRECRAQQIENALVEANKLGYRVFFITLTSSRTADPRDVVEVYNKTLNSVFGGLKRELVLAGVDISTYGDSKGLDFTIKPDEYHPLNLHFHCLVMFKDDDFKISDGYLCSWIKRRWVDAFNKNGRRFGVDAHINGQDARRVFDVNGAGISRYLTKSTNLGREISYGGFKSAFEGFSLTQFLFLCTQLPDDEKLRAVYLLLVRTLARKQIVRLNGSMKMFGRLKSDQLEPKSELLNELFFSDNLYGAIQKSGYKYLIGDLMVAYWEQGSHKKVAQLVIMYAAESLKTERRLSSWSIVIEQLVRVHYANELNLHQSA
jgi:hypothetical protein